MEQASRPDAAAVRADYEARLDARLAEERRAAGRVRALANLRLAVFAVAAGMLWAALWPGWLSAAWLLLPALAFVVLVLRHDTARRERERAERAAAHYQRALDRLDYRFAGHGRSGEAFADPDHPYAFHLDVLGRGSLFELLCDAQTGAGERRLAEWLLAPAAPDTVRQRQQAVSELAPRVDLREDLAVLGPSVRDAVHPDELVRWGRAEIALPASGARWVALALSLAMVAAVAAWALTPLGLGPVLVVGALEAVFALGLRSRVSEVLRAVDRPAQDLGVLAGLLERLESEPCEAPLLRELSAALETDGAPPSAQLARLRRLVSLLDSRRNQFFALIAPLLLWGTQHAFAIEAWRARCGGRLGPWLETVGSLEALCDLARQSWEHPDDPFPELVDEGPPRFEAAGLGHPLMPEASFVRNDVTLGGDAPLWVISGSNMSGKSTLLRSVGINAVLALAGGTVRARTLRLSPLAIGASLRVQDSLADGKSRFYAEITTLKRAVSLCEGERPLLFLLDEILAGTNSHDRRIGASAVVRGLIERGAIGMITTHDLALTRITEQLGERARNVHFEEQFRDGEMDFDYRLRDGVVERSNALELMRAVGLDV